MSVDMAGPLRLTFSAIKKTTISKNNDLFYLAVIVSFMPQLDFSHNVCLGAYKKRKQPEKSKNPNFVLFAIFGSVPVLRPTANRLLTKCRYSMASVIYIVEYSMGVHNCCICHRQVATLTIIFNKTRKETSDKRVHPGQCVTRTIQ